MAGQVEFATSKAILSGHGTSEEAYSLNYFLEHVEIQCSAYSELAGKGDTLTGQTRQPIKSAGSPTFVAPASPSRSMAMRTT